MVNVAVGVIRSIELGIRLITQGAQGCVSLAVSVMLVSLSIATSIAPNPVDLVNPSATSTMTGEIVQMQGAMTCDARSSAVPASGIVLSCASAGGGASARSAANHSRNTRFIAFSPLISEVFGT